jgi:hypothetical protein
MSVTGSPVFTPAPPGSVLVQDLFKAILEICGVATLDEQPEASDMQKVKRHVNLLLDSLSARRLLQLSTTSEQFPLTAGAGSYTIGQGAVWNTDKPINLTSAYLLLQGDRHPVEIITQSEYQRWDSNPGRPTELYYDAGATQIATPVGTIHLNPVPDTTATLVLDSVKYLTEFTSLTAAVTFPKAYHSMLVYNGAMVCWRPLGRTGPPPPDIRMQAERTMKVVENMNARQNIMSTDLPRTVAGSGWNIMTGGYN